MAEGLVRYENRDGIAIVTIDNPPLNVLSGATREQLLAAITAAAKDDAARAIVLTGAGKTFPAGADIAEFGGPFKAPHLNEICTALDDVRKPAIAALTGTPLGGGLEIALACHYRLAAKDARLGFPEVKLGLLPGAGGSQRLPRLAGAKLALEMICSGDPVGAALAKEAGFVDEIVEGDVLEAAIVLAKRKAEEPLPPRARDRSDKIDAESEPALFDAQGDGIKRTRPGQHAPLRCLEAVENAFRMPFDAGLAAERALFDEALADDQTKALIHIFFAERQTRRLPDFLPAAAPRGVARVGIVGAGTMGAGIAMAFANAGFPVILLDRDQAALDRGLGAIAGNYRGMAARGRLEEATGAARVNAIRGALDYQALAGADLVIEAVFEDLDVKEGVLRALDHVMKPGALLATNTSTLDIDKLAAFTGRPADVIGMHFFSPANVMRLLEVVRGKATSPEAIATAMEVGRAIGKVTVLAGNCDGFIGNRMLEKYINEAMVIVEEGASPAEVDTALTRFGLAMGPFAMLDLAGLDVSWRIRQRRLAEGRSYGSPLMDLFHEAGRFGQKTGKGFYRYEPGHRAPLPDPEADSIVAASRAAAGGRPRAVPEVEIAKRCVFALVNEGANVLADGIALRAGDIDAAYVYGYGFPAWRGGPMKYAELRGLAAVLNDISTFETRFGERWRAAPLLKQLVAEGERGWPRAGRAPATPECE